MRHLALFEILRFHLPHLFHAQPVCLWLRVTPQFEHLHYLLGQTTIAALVKKRILSLVAGVAPSKREAFSSESQSGRSSLMARGSRTLPDRICAPISGPFSRTTTRNSSLPASLASCFKRMAALRPAGP